MGEVVYPDIPTSLDIPVERVLDGASESDLEVVVVLGYTKDGMEFFSSSVADGGTVLWLLERAKKELIE
jgi:hypothetical protein